MSEEAKKEVIKIMKAQSEAEEKGEHDFVCPLCGGRAHWARSLSNNHLSIRCGDCGFLMME